MLFGLFFQHSISVFDFLLHAGICQIILELEASKQLSLNFLFPWQLGESIINIFAAFFGSKKLSFLRHGESGRLIELVASPAEVVLFIFGRFNI
jgi:hypothetical protein